MTKYIGLAILLFVVNSPVAARAENPPVRKLKDINGTPIALFKTSKGFVSARCANDLDSCVAQWEIKFETRSVDVRYPSSPATLACEGAGGRSLTGLDQEGNEHALCVLPERRIVDAWDLYRWQQERAQSRK